jgi:DNA polymerase III delta prime subunit
MAANELKFITPNKQNKRLKLMLYGPAGVGKTTAAIQFPNPAIIDTERGAENDQYVDLIKSKGGAILQTSSFDEVIGQIRALASNTHSFRTLVIDPVTTVYETLADQWKRRVGDAFFKHRTEASNDWKRLCRLAETLDMNVVLTAHSKNEWSNGEMTGRQVYDGPKGADYWLDLLIQVERKEGKRYGLPTKSRIETIPVDEPFEFSYDAIANMYGRDVLERDAVAIQFATEEQVAEIEERLSKRSDGEELYGKMLTKNKVASFSDIQAETAERILEWLKAN